MTKVFCRHCATFLGEYHGTAIGAGRELRDKIGGVCPKCGNVFHDRPRRMFFWQRGYWAWQKRREIPVLVIRSPIVAVTITGIFALYDKLFLGPWLVGLVGGLAIAVFILLRDKQEEKPIVIRA